MDGAVIGDNTIVAGGAFVREGAVVPPNSIVMGVPAQVTKTRNNWIANRLNAF
ncbi:MAG: gamma carbonic anhydrase family protein, partial [Alphaproteobacteria bacterium]